MAGAPKFSEFLRERGWITEDKVGHPCCGAESCCGEIIYPMDADQLDKFFDEWLTEASKVEVNDVSAPGH